MKRSVRDDEARGGINMEKTPVRILYVNGGLMHRNGTEAFMMNYYRRFDRSLLQIDFVVHGEGKGEYDEEIISLGGKIYHVPVKSKHPFAYPRALKKIFSRGYRVVHTHTDAMGCWILKVAKACGVPVRVAHSHNTGHLTKSPLKVRLNEYARKNIVKYATHCFACSEAAGKWLFGDHPFTVVRNAIDLEKFAFCPSAREEVRAELGLSPSDFAVGHVGRFAPQKNHGFLLEAFRAFASEEPRAKLLLVGDGELRTEIRDKAAAYGIADRILFLGVRTDTDRLYSAMDAFVLPSLFEGLPVVALEAQANGLPCLLSESVSREAGIAEAGVRFLPFDVEEWTHALKETEKARRMDNTEALRRAGYDIASESGKLQDFYLHMAAKTAEEENGRKQKQCD